MVSQPTETTSLLPEPATTRRHPLPAHNPDPDLDTHDDDGDDMVGKPKRSWKRYAPLALVGALGIITGVGATIGYEHRPREKPPMVPPIWKLPPPTGLPRNPAYLVEGSGGVASEDRTCSELGVQILRDQNGTAVDAAITTTLCIGLLNAFSSGIGGGGFALVSVPAGHGADVAYDVDEGMYAGDGGAQAVLGGEEGEEKNRGGGRKGSPKVVAIDFREESPGATTEDMYKKKGRAASQVGGLAVGVPGELRGLEAAHRVYGRVAWSDLVMPVAKLARQWQVSRELARRIRLFGGFMLEDPVWAAVYAPRGELLVEGDWVSRPTYAATLERIAAHGPGALYDGAIADDIVDTVRRHGGILTHEDLTQYKARVYPAISGTFRGDTVYSADAPASGGVMIGMLQILDPLLPLSDPETCWDERNTHLTLEAMKFAFGARSEVCDPRFAKNLTRLAEFRTPEWADAQRAKITNGTHDPAYYGLETDAPTDHGTTHLSVVDQWGGAASVTSTVNLIWGSHVMCPKTGIILNDEQDDFGIPGESDAFGLPPSPHNYPAAGKRPLSSTAPTIVHTPKGEVKAVLGGSGGSRIFPSVAQVLLNLACGENISAAIERPRWHDQVVPRLAALEVGPDGYDHDLAAGLEKRGHKIGVYDINVGASEVQGVVVHKGTVYASSDSRKNGVAAAY